MLLPGRAPAFIKHRAPHGWDTCPSLTPPPCWWPTAWGIFPRKVVDVEQAGHGPVVERILTESFLAGKFDLTHMLFPIPVWMRFRQHISRSKSWPGTIPTAAQSRSGQIRASAGLQILPANRWQCRHGTPCTTWSCSWASRSRDLSR